MINKKQPYSPQAGIDYNILAVDGENATVEVYIADVSPITQIVAVRKDGRGRSYVRVRFAYSIRRIYLN